MWIGGAGLEGSNSTKLFTEREKIHNTCSIMSQCIHNGHVNKNTHLHTFVITKAVCVTAATSVLLA